MQGRQKWWTVLSKSDSGALAASFHGAAADASTSRVGSAWEGTRLSASQDGGASARASLRLGSSCPRRSFAFHLDNEFFNNHVAIASFVWLFFSFVYLREITAIFKESVVTSGESGQRLVSLPPGTGQHGRAQRSAHSQGPVKEQQAREAGKTLLNSNEEHNEQASATAGTPHTHHTPQ